MSSKYNKHGTFKYNIIVFERWSFGVPILCYLLLFCMIWILSVPLKPNLNIKIAETDNLNKKLEDTFEIKIKNSNFNSDKTESENKILNDKNEYLVNVNNEENVHRDQADILQDVFKKYYENYSKIIFIVRTYVFKGRS